MNDTTERLEKKQIEKAKRLRYLGWLFFVISMLSAVMAYSADFESVRDYIPLSPTEQEGYFMMSIVMGVLGMFCFKSTTHPQ
ncbi:hypothetical protein [Estrella lausannensis]|uniref:Conserved putative membrane protein n=1 Tax=Estrella lausannensis TaxID=483423 RepID=A0A0H5DS42_9BACT|nr:hypothetical protein [Estrella lausannensis]CRX38549.1 Conserved putative membrane protein [Estrella lausannensis]